MSKIKFLSEKPVPREYLRFATSSDINFYIIKKGDFLLNQEFLNWLHEDIVNGIVCSSALSSTIYNEAFGKNVHCIVAFKESTNESIGYIVLAYDVDNQDDLSANIVMVYVFTDFRRMNIGSNLVFLGEDLIKSRGKKNISLKTYTDFEWVENFYEKLGYKKLSESLNNEAIYIKNI